MGNKLKDFRLVNYEERSRLLSALDLYRQRWGRDEELDALVHRLSRTECQPGGCAMCNAERAREEADYYADAYAENPPHGAKGHRLSRNCDQCQENAS